MAKRILSIVIFAFVLSIIILGAVVMQGGDILPEESMVEIETAIFNTDIIKNYIVM
ncbi:MAG: hypothetical protein K2H01_07765 [Ruminococcus sp.]|nr:hypothetical protein [Ruminococcus sp.]